MFFKTIIISVFGGIILLLGNNNNNNIISAKNINENHLTCNHNKNVNYNNSNNNNNSVVIAKFIKKYKMEKFFIWCSPSNGYRGIGLHVKGQKRVNSHINITKDDIALHDKGLWHQIHLEIVYEYQWRYVTYDWYLFVSVDEHPRMKFSFIDWGYVNEYLEYVNVTAYGPSRWSFTKPSEKGKTIIIIIEPEEKEKEKNCLINTTPICYEPCFIFLVIGNFALYIIS